MKNLEIAYTTEVEKLNDDYDELDTKLRREITELRTEMGKKDRKIQELQDLNASLTRKLIDQLDSM